MKKNFSIFFRQRIGLGKTICLRLGLIVLAFGAFAFVAQSQVSTVSTKEVMKFKLFYAQGVLEGIATENFSLIETNAIKLKALSQEADWQIRNTPEYQRLTTEFAQRAEQLEKAAKKQNVDAATVAYFQMTVACTTCHKYLRGAHPAKAEVQDRNETSSVLARWLE